jgi:hypothetical protein
MISSDLICASPSCVRDGLVHDAANTSDQPVELGDVGSESMVQLSIGRMHELVLQIRESTREVRTQDLGLLGR